MAKIKIRAAGAEDIGAIARVAAATGQTEEWSGSDPAYTAHLLRHGTVVVCEADGRVAGFAAARRIGTGARAVTMLCDLFVDPARHGQGIGRAMLAAVWDGRGPRMTFSSLHANALPLYTSAGLDAWWPLLYLSGPVAVLATPGGWAVERAGPQRAAALERDWTGIDREADHRDWAGRPAGAGVVARRDGEELAAGTVAGGGGEYGIVHLALAPAAGEAEARDAVLAVLASLDAPVGRARACLPAPHPAVRPLLAAGWRTGDFDLFMATGPGLLDPRRAVPSPGEA
jgi:GNAT superfamily N-acetyltransferase